METIHPSTNVLFEHASRGRLRVFQNTTGRNRARRQAALRRVYHTSDTAAALRQQRDR